MPLVLIGFEAYENLTLSRARPWVAAYAGRSCSSSRWRSGIWSGAGLFGFLINPPIALYYMQGLNTTPVHGHAALFGVYGMLGIGLMLFCLRGPDASGALEIAHAVLQLLVHQHRPGPDGAPEPAAGRLLQTWASVEHGMWYARSAEFMQTPLMQNLRWMRVIGDTIFAAGRRRHWLVRAGPEDRLVLRR